MLLFANENQSFIVNKKKKKKQMLLNLHDKFQILLEQQFKTFLFENDLKMVFPELFLVLACLILLIYGVIYSTSKHNNYPMLLGNISWLAQLSLIFTILLLANNPIHHAVIFYNTLVIDDLCLFVKIVVVFGALFSIFISLDYIKREAINAFEYIILIVLSTCSMLFLISSADFISMYLAIEMQSLCFYVLAASKRESEFSTEAGLKYFLLGAFSSGLLLFGCSLIYGFTGITNFSECAKLFTCGAEDMVAATSSLHACVLGMIFICAGFLFKLTAVPFHMWAPDVYEGAPTSITAFFSITPKAAILAVFVRIFMESFYDFMDPWQKVLIVSSVASMILGAFAAMSQNKIKRLLAYSSIGHVGYLLVGFCCGTIQGLQALFIYLVIYMVMTINIFAIVLSPIRSERLKYTTDLAFLAKTNPLLALTLSITIFSMAGIPPLAGFYSKAYLFFAALSSSLYSLAVIGVLTSVISCFYYIRIVKIMYFETPKTWCSFSRLARENSLALAITLFFILFFIYYPSPLYLVTHKIALSLCA
jgi:proton-translocating NADH-quinone oxidoreductase chain N